MSEKPNFLEDIQKDKPESFKEEVFTVRKRDYKPLYAILGFISILAFILFFIFNRGVVVPDMTNWKEGEVYNWGKDNDITIVNKSEYNLDVDSGLVFEQGVKAGKKVRKSSSIDVKISLGPDPNETITMVDFKTSDENTLKEWIATNKLTGISIRYETSQLIPKGAIIDYEIVDGTADNFKRKNRVNVYISSGLDNVSESVTVPDFYKNAKGTVVQWGEKNGIEIVFTEVIDEYVDSGMVRSQNIQANTKISRDDSIEIEISLGPAITVPDFVGMSKTEATDLATRKGVTLYFEQQESESDPDMILYQDIVAGSSVAKSQPVMLTVSKESEYLTVPDFIGLTQTEASNLATLNNIRLFFVTKKNTEESNLVIDQSIPENGLVKRTSYVTLYISSGDIIVPNFVELSKTECESMAEMSGLTLVFNEVDTIETQNGTVLKQSVEPGTIIGTDKSQKILLDVAVNTGVIAPDFSMSTKDEVLRWATKNNLTNKLYIIENYSDTYSYGKLYNQSIKNELIPNNENVIVYYSLGKIPVPDFTSKTKIDVTQWLNDINSKGGSITVSYSEIKSSIDNVGLVVSQSHKSEFINLNTKVSVYVGKMDEITVPDFSKMSLLEVKRWGADKSVTITFKEYYSTTKTNDAIFYQSVVDKLLSPKDGVTVHYSRNKIFIPSFVNATKQSVMEWIESANLRGCNLVASYSSVSSSTTAVGNISAQSSHDVDVSLNSTITFYVVSSIASSSNTPTTESIYIPDMTGSLVSTFEFWCTTNDVDYEIFAQYHNTYLKDIVYNQSYVNNYMEVGTKLKAYRSLGPPKVPAYGGAGGVQIQKDEIITWLTTLNTAGANITISNYSEVLNKAAAANVSAIKVGTTTIDSEGQILTGATVTIEFAP